MRTKKTETSEDLRIKVERDEWREMAHRLANIVNQAGCYKYPSYEAYLKLLERYPTPAGDNGKQE